MFSFYVIMNLGLLIDGLMNTIVCALVSTIAYVHGSCNL